MKSKYIKSKIGSIVTKYKLLKLRLIYPNDLSEEKRLEYLEFTRKFDACLTALGKEKEKIFHQTNPQMEWRPGGTPGTYFDNLYAEKEAADKTTEGYDEHSAAVKNAANAEEAKLKISQLLAKELGIEAGALAKITSEYEKHKVAVDADVASVENLTKAEQENAIAATESKLAEEASTDSQIKDESKRGQFITHTGDIIAETDVDRQGRRFVVDGKEYNLAADNYRRITELIGLKAEPDPELSPTDSRAIAAKRTSNIGTFSHRITELMGKYGANSYEELEEMAKDLTLRHSSEDVNLKQALSDIRNWLKAQLGTDYTPTLVDDTVARINSVFATAKKRGYINSDTDYEHTFAGKFANSDVAISGQADFINDNLGLVGDWKFSGESDEATVNQRILQVSAYRFLRMQELEAELDNIDKQIGNTPENNEARQKLEKQREVLEAKLAKFENDSKVVILRAQVGKNGEAFTEVIESEAVREEEIAKFLEGNLEYQLVLEKIAKIQKRIEGKVGKKEVNEVDLAEANKLKKKILEEALGQYAIDESKELVRNANKTYYDAKGNIVNTGDEGENYFKHTHASSRSVMNQYVSNKKAQYRIEEDIQKAQNKAAGMTGQELTSQQALINGLQVRLNELKAQELIYDKEAGTLGDITLTEKERLDLEQRLVNAANEHNTKQLAINAALKQQQSFLQKLVGGFKRQITMFIDTSLAYQAIGRVRSSIRQVISTTQELDKKLVDLQIATGGTREETTKLLKSYVDLGKELGRTTTEVAAASNDWLRAGYEGKEAAELTRASMMLSTLGMIESSEATSYLISTLKGWKLNANEVIDVVSKLAAVDMSAAINNSRNI